MTDKRRFVLAHPQARQRAIECVAEAPDGWTVIVAPPKRSTSQNAMLWPLLECFAAQAEWPVNGRMTKLEAEDWKSILSAAYQRETQRVAMGLDGGLVILGLRTSKMSKARFSEFLEFIMATAADRGVAIAAPMGTA